jgi:uncharacterized protein YcbX
MNASNEHDPAAPRLAAIWRYPVKSLQGEQLAEARLDSDGLRGDRCWGIRDDATGRILTARREPRLLLAAATMSVDGEPEIKLPDGQTCQGAGPQTDAALSDWLGKQVGLVEASGEPGARAEFFADATDDASLAIEWTMPAGRFVDAMALLVLTTASLRAGQAAYPEGEWEVRRFRPKTAGPAGHFAWGTPPSFRGRAVSAARWSPDRSPGLIATSRSTRRSTTTTPALSACGAR